jgi:hypothetical protein
MADLDDELRQLFTADGLDVQVRPDAEHVIVAGARRVRRRRIVAATASGALGVVIVVVAGILLTGSTPDAMPPATATDTTSEQVSAADIPSTSPSSQTSSTTPSPESASVHTTTKPSPPSTPVTTSDPGPPRLNFQVVGPTGFHALRLGQTLEEARATGMVGAQVPDNGGACPAYELVGDVAGRVYIGSGVQAIFPEPAQTVEGVGAGWTVAQVKEVYPDLDEAQLKDVQWDHVAVPGNPAALYELAFADGVVTSVALVTTGDFCN